MKDLNDKVVVITGAGSGMGREMALLAARRGALLAVSDWNEDLQQRMQRTVWNTGGCASWYLDAHGRNTTLWPRTTFKFRSLLSEFDTEQYVVTSRHAATEPKERVA